VPVAVPTEVGLKTTLMVQDEFATTVSPQVPFPPNANGPLMMKLPLKVRVVPPVLVNVAYSIALVEPIAEEGKLMDPGTFTAGLDEEYS